MNGLDAGFRHSPFAIGGQDSKVVAVGPGGKPLDFAMNDKCAALPTRGGTG